MKKILVTGGAGFIGSHAIISLIEANYKPIIFDNFSNSSTKSVKRVSEITGKKIELIQGDIRDSKLLDNIFIEHEIESVIHFAGLKAVGESVLHPMKYYDNNVQGSLKLFMAMAKHNVKKIVFSSSATVYGTPKDLPIKEYNSELKPANPYGATKLHIENILRDIYISDNSWGIMNLRYFNPIGAHSSGKIGDNPLGVPNNIMPMIIQTVSGKIKELMIHGNDYNTHDGTGVRDYIHVMDLVDGHIKALEKINKNSGLWSINLGTGTGYSVLDLVSCFESVSGVKVPFKISDRRPGDIDSCYADSSYAKEILNWEATRSLEEMCRDSWHWQSKNPSGYD